MRRCIYVLLFLSVSLTSVYGKMQDFTADTSPDATDIMWTTKDPTGTPLDRKATLANLKTYIQTAIPGANVTVDTILEAALDCTNSATDNNILSFDNATGGFTWVTNDWDDIGAAGADDTIALAGYEVGFSTTIDESGGVAMTIDHTDTNGITNDTHLLELQHSNNGDANAEYLLITDNNTNVKMEIVEEGKIIMTPGDVGEVDGVIKIVPSAAITSTNVDWDGIKIDGSALDPSVVEVEICGIEVEFNGVLETNFPNIKGVKIELPTASNAHAIDIDEGQLHHSYTAGSAAGAEYTVHDIILNIHSLNAASEVHAIDVAVAEGTPVGEVVALGTHANVAPIKQSIGSYTTPSQTEFAGRETGGGATWVDGVDGIEVFVADNDEVFVGAATQFSEIEVDMTTEATKNCNINFYYCTAADAWTQFYPADDTNGFKNDGIIRWDLGDISGSWTGDGDPGGAGSTAGYWIRLRRTRNSDPGTPTPATVKIGAITDYEWSKDGALSVASVVATGAIQGNKNVVTDADGIVLTSAQMNTYLLMTGASEVTIPDVCDSATGEWIKVITRDAEAIEVVSADGSDQFVLADGTVLTAGNEADIPATASAFACFVCLETNKWYVMDERGTVTDGSTAD